MSARFVILVAVAFDETGDSALEIAARSTELHPDAQLHVIHVMPEHTADDVDGERFSFNARLARAPEQLKERVEQLWSHKRIQVTGHIRAGNPAKCVLQAAVDFDADLIVVGTHKRTGVDKLVSGSVAERIVREAHCAVLIAVPKDHAQSTHGGGIEPVCAKCAAMRRATDGNRYWCERHERSRLHPYVFNPADPKPVGKPG
jgi:nucleotide-binding universal stress UspA family protein